jgi:hypothetical protein
MTKRVGTDRTQEEIDGIIKQMESHGFTYSLFRKKSMFTNPVTKQRITMKGAARFLKQL